ncbi:MAG: protein kinase [Deltaproteobacteria bacterium]|nr:protein kinase [Deltaproteobacteria bacterium]
MLQAVAGSATLGRYTLLRRLAVGGMGEIFIARGRVAADADRLVVIKRLLRDPIDDGDPVARLRDEARILAYLAHPNIVQVHELGEDAGELFLAMELVAGQNLGRVLATLARHGRRLPLPIGGYAMIEAARGLAYAHQAVDASGAPLHVVHRDVSPSNILLGYRGEVKLADFGIAKATNRHARTRTGHVHGKSAYMAPEQVRGQSLDARADVWALGVVAWEVLVGRALFRGDGELEILTQVVDRPVPHPSSIDPSIPPAIGAVVMAALERDLDRRTATADRFARDLREAFRDSLELGDADELAALMRATFPDEQAELDALREAPVIEAATERRPAAPTPEVQHPAASPRPSPGRGRAAPLAIALVALAAIVGTVVLVAAGLRGAPAGTPIDARAAGAAPTDAPSPDAPVATTDAPPLDAAPPDAPSLDAREARHDHAVTIDAPAMPQAPDAAPPRPAPIDAAAPDPAQIRVGTDIAELAIDGKRYRGGSPRVAPGHHRIEVSLISGATLATDVEAAPGAILKCRVDRGALVCGP